MESNNSTFRIILIVTLIMILSPVESKCVRLRDSFVARSLLSVLPPSESDSPSPAPVPEASAPVQTPAESPDSPAPSPDASADSIPPTEAENDYETDAPSPNPSADSPAPSENAPAEAPTEEDLDAPVPSPSSGKSIINAQKIATKTPLLALSPVIKAICSKTDTPPLCESAVSPLVTPGFKPDATSVLILMIQGSINATKTAQAAVGKLDSPDCVELYDSAVTNLEDAINAVKKKDIPTVDSNLSAAMTDYGTCNDGFEEAGEPNPIADVAGKLTKMVSNCLSISATMRK